MMGRRTEALRDAVTPEFLREAKILRQTFGHSRVYATSLNEPPNTERPSSIPIRRAASPSISQHGSLLRTTVVPPGLHEQAGQQGKGAP